MHPSNEAFIPEARVGPLRVWTGLVLNGNYKIGSLIEQGSTFELYEGTQISTNDRVCLKVLLPQLAADPKTAALFLDEARVIARLDHPGLLRYRACARDPGPDLAYIVMDSLGPRLSARIALLRPKAQHIFEFSRRLASALAAAHRAGVIHGHLSPASVLLPEEGLGNATLAGFNLIKTKTSSAFDRAIQNDYLAPEQLNMKGADNDIGPWTDMYSFALVILATLNGKDGCRDVSLLPRKLRPIFTKMLQANPRHRFGSMDDVVELLDGILLDSRPLRNLATRLQGSLGSLSQFVRLRLARMSRPAAAAGRGSLAAAAVLIAASPWLLQTKLPRSPVDARATTTVIQMQPSVTIEISEQPAASSGDATANNLSLMPEAVPLPSAKPEIDFVEADQPKRRAATAGPTVRPRNQAERAMRAAADSKVATRQERSNALDQEREADQTAWLNADQTRRVIGSNDEAGVEDQAVQADPTQEVPVLVSPSNPQAVETPPSDRAATAGQLAGDRATPGREADSPPLLQSLSPQLPDLVAARPIEQTTAPAAKTLDEQAITAKTAEERVKAGAERKLREWCKAQRRSCTFPTRP